MKRDDGSRWTFHSVVKLQVDWKAPHCALSQWGGCNPVQALSPGTATVALHLPIADSAEENQEYGREMLTVSNNVFKGVRTIQRDQ